MRITVVTQLKIMVLTDIVNVSAAWDINAPAFIEMKMSCVRYLQLWQKVQVIKLPTARPENILSILLQGSIPNSELKAKQQGAYYAFCYFLSY